jgi:hypothetical protein
MLAIWILTIKIRLIAKFFLECTLALIASWALGILFKAIPGVNKKIL